MTIQKAKTVEEIYDEVKNYDLVLTVDAPLSDAINTRLESPVLGNFAITPRRLVYSQRQNQDLIDRRQLFIEVIHRTDLTWKQSVYLLDNIIDCWQETGNLHRILEYPEFDSRATRQVINVIENTENIFRAMDEYTVDEDLSVAVVALHQFNALDRKVLPENYDVIDPLKDEEHELPEFKVFNSATSLIQAIRDNVSPQNAHEAAVVMNPDSQYRPLAESALQADDIPYMYTEEFSDNEDLRTFLKILRTALSGSRLRVSDLRPILPEIDKDIRVTHNEKLLHEIDELDGFKEFAEKLDDLTFDEAVSELEDLSRSKFEDELRENLEELGILDSRVTEENVNGLEYYLDTFDIPEEEGNYGVLFASSLAAAYVDRPFVFHVGLDASWTHDIPYKPWTDREKHEERFLKDFQILLQNGQNTYFLVQDTIKNQKVTPCFYFYELLSNDAERFIDFDNHAKYRNPLPSEGEGFDPPTDNEYELPPKEIQTLSQSSLKKLVSCPRQYFFSRVLDIPRTYYFERGELLHDFAEFYVNHPDFVLDRGADDFVEIMLDSISPYVDPLELDIYETDFRIGIKNIIELIDSEEVEEFDIEGYEKEDSTNTFSQHYNLPLESKITEVTFDNPDIGAKGRVDLLGSDDHIIDYKTGSMSNVYRSSLVKKAKVDLLDDDDTDPNFQSIHYLMHHREVIPNSDLYFSFFYPLDNVEDDFDGNRDPYDSLLTIDYYPRTFREHIPERETFDYLYRAKTRKRLLDPLGYENYREVFLDLSVSNEALYDKDMIQEELFDELVRECHTYLEIGRGKDLTENQLESAVKSILKKLVTYHKNCFFEDDVDRHEEFVNEKIDEVNRYRRTRFPVGDIDREDLDREFMDLVIEDD
ncbi:MAG: PD-(D/E)XK nuclease family protein [Halobacteria archaeon]|nr:PD-(D/E)XK nuclease family protein [Halobacteria archaeon]